MRSADPTRPDADTFDRSCAHWSEAGRTGMEHFYVLATEDYRQLAVSHAWAQWLADRERCVAGHGLRLLDVACGSGKFPSALQAHASVGNADLAPIQYDLLDPTQFALEEARGVLRHPFVPGASYRCRLQDLELDGPGYDVVWATHALYALPPHELADGLSRFVTSLKGGGIGFIAHACEDSHYLGFYRAYLDAVKGGAGTPYSSAEQIVDTLGRLGVRTEARDIVYEGMAPASDTAAVEGYLQRCLFDNTLSLTDMLRDDVLGHYLAHCLDADRWRFAQRVKLIFITP